jgi:hypothetical protein
MKTENQESMKMVCVIRKWKKGQLFLLLLVFCLFSNSELKERWKQTEKFPLRSSCCSSCCCRIFIHVNGIKFYCASPLSLLTRIFHHRDSWFYNLISHPQKFSKNFSSTRNYVKLSLIMFARWKLKFLRWFKQVGHMKISFIWKFHAKNQTVNACHDWRRLTTKFDFILESRPIIKNWERREGFCEIRASTFDIRSTVSIKPNFSSS